MADAAGRTADVVTTCCIGSIHDTAKMGPSVVGTAVSRRRTQAEINWNSFVGNVDDLEKQIARIKTGFMKLGSTYVNKYRINSFE